MTALETILIQTATALPIAVATSFLTVRLALKRYYREKWWEVKMRAYTDIIQALHVMKRDLDISISRELSGREETEYHKEWEKKHHAAWDEIRKQIDVGEFLFSAKSLSILGKLKHAADNEIDEGYYLHLENLQRAVDKCLPAIRGAAREDLGLPKHH